MSDIAKQIVNVPFLTGQANYAEWSTAVENLALLGDCWDQMTGEDKPYDDSVAEKAKFHGRYNKAKGLIGSTVITPIQSELKALPTITTTRVKVEAKDSQAEETHQQNNS